MRPHVTGDSALILDEKIIAGYISSRLFATLRGEEYRKNIAMTAMLFPTCVLASSSSTCAF